MVRMSKIGILLLMLISIYVIAFGNHHVDIEKLTTELQGEIEYPDIVIKEVEKNIFSPTRVKVYVLWEGERTYLLRSNYWHEYKTWEKELE